ncbi:low-density lipoprotein receptor-related protein 10 isoform X1 [Latimeria chalumnae]|uniref:low-density lipoprotein receptor-related protein 10 isoform X1 n=1 Tax=Latimeria chalumnae TaxID=7897 RepID=UPI0006D940D0|nr:PREDICTED: GTP-binding protein REM 2 isoform X2 [Latimeria chalumnae]|eukprot:XP_014342969.1 PREDICTED: GTP-binding protein REM 2 isoform X2 [Latimeria chalumnae]
MWLWKLFLLLVSLAAIVIENESAYLDFEFSSVPACRPEEFQCRSSQCVPALARCNSEADCYDGSDEEGCDLTLETDCTRTLEKFYGTFASPGYETWETVRVPRSNCIWLIDPHDSRRITLTFVALELSEGDFIQVYDGSWPASESPLRILKSTNNYQRVSVESTSGKLTIFYHADGAGRGFNATYQVYGYCLPWDHPCGEDGGCYTDAQHCNGLWDCASGRDEEACGNCGEGRYACNGGKGGMCYSKAERCNYQAYCSDKSDERNCWSCQLGNFHCDVDKCIFETWLCDGQKDCKDGSDEQNCPFVLPRKVITAAVIGSLICSLLLVIALGCTCKLYSLRSHEHSVFGPLSRMEAQLIQRQAPPSYGQLIAQGAIPPVEDFPTDDPGDTSVLGNLRAILQALRQDPNQPNGGRRHRRNRHVRRLLRRLRRWGLLPRSTSSTATRGPGSAGMTGSGTSPNNQAADADNAGATGGPSSEGDVSASPLPPKFPLLDSRATSNEEPQPTTTAAAATDHTQIQSSAGEEAGNTAAPHVELARSGGLLMGVVRGLRERWFTPWSRHSETEMLVPNEVASAGLEEEDEVLLVLLSENRPDAPPQYSIVSAKGALSTELEGQAVLEEVETSEDDSLLVGCPR